MTVMDATVMDATVTAVTVTAGAAETGAMRRSCGLHRRPRSRLSPASSDGPASKRPSAGPNAKRRRGCRSRSRSPSRRCNRRDRTPVFPHRLSRRSATRNAWHRRRATIDRVTTAPRARNAAGPMCRRPRLRRRSPSRRYARHRRLRWLRPRCSGRPCSRRGATPTFPAYTTSASGPTEVRAAVVASDPSAASARGDQGPRPAAALQRSSGFSPAHTLASMVGWACAFGWMRSGWKRASAFGTSATPLSRKGTRAVFSAFDTVP